MSDKTNTSTKKNESLDKVFDAVIDLFFMFFDIIKEGFKTKKWKKSENLWLAGAIVFLLGNIIIKDYHIDLIKHFSFDIFHPVIMKLTSFLGIYWELIIMCILIILAFLAFMGLAPYQIKRKYQKGVDRLRFKSGLDERPKVLTVEDLNENRTKLLVKSAGLGQERYRSRLDDLRASVGQRVESVDFYKKDNTMVEIYLARKPLEKLVKYSDVSEKLSRPYSFIVGKSLGGIINQSIEDLPHLMIGGTSGGGKSHTFNNVLVNVLESSNYLQMYLIDLKGGLEIKDYENLSHVELIKDVQGATIALKKLVDEMNRRYKYLEEKGYKKLNPKRDKMNRIVVAVDECTDLLGQVPRNHADYSYISKAIEYCDELARKARASGIHLILATQKIDKSSIPTRIQENMQGRIAMRVKTMENSVRMLGNRLAYDLPAIPGRAIWSKDSDFKEIQVPLISDDEVKVRVQKVREDMEKGLKKNFKAKLEKSKTVPQKESDEEQWVEEDDSSSEGLSNGTP